jgi:DNA-binding transcriptional MocR family regulator
MYPGMDTRLAGANSIEAVLGRWSDGPGPLHLKLSDALRQAIDLGHLAAGERLPSERELATRLAVSRSTVVAAYDALRGERRLESRQGSGTRVCGRPRGNGGGTTAHELPMRTFPVSQVYRSLLEGRDDIISLSCAVLPAHPLVIEAVADIAAHNEKLFSLIGYVPAGLPELREALADMLTGSGTPTTPDQLVITNGAQQAVNLAAQLFVRPGDDVLVESPSFAGTIDVFRGRGARLVTAPVDEDGVDIEVVGNVLATRKPRLIYVMPSFHNPTGALMSEHRRRQLAALAESEGVPLIEDNALEHAPLDDAWLRPIAAFGGPDSPVLTAGSLSKVAWGGLRVGWLRGPVPVIKRIAELKAMNDLGSPLLEQAIAAQLVPQLERLRADYCTTLRRHLDVITELLADELPEWRWRRPRGGPSLWIRLPSGTAAAYAQVALRYGVEVIPGEVMSPTADHGDHLRLPFTLEPPVLEETVRRLAAAWRAYAPGSDARTVSRPVVV